MNSPIDEFMTSIREYASAIVSGPEMVAFYTMLNVGDGGLARVGIVPPPPPGERDQRTQGEATGHHTLDQVEARLRQLSSQGVDQAFLVRALFRFIEDELEEQLEGYGAGRRRARAEADNLEKLRQDPEALASLDARVAEAGGPVGPADETIVEIIAMLREPASLVDLKKRRDSLERWRTVVGPVVTREKRFAWYRQRAGLPPTDADVD
jgi:hypothetical protein